MVWGWWSIPGPGQISLRAADREKLVKLQPVIRRHWQKTLMTISWSVELLCDCVHACSIHTHTIISLMIGHLTTSILKWHCVWLHKRCHASFLFSDQWLLRGTMTHLCEFCCWLHAHSGWKPLQLFICRVCFAYLPPHSDQLQYL